MTVDELKGKYFKVLNVGFVSLVDCMGSDAAIEQAARVSYGEGTRTVNQTRGLLRYLMRHRHCYAPEMEVLLADGWRRWDACKSFEYFVVPDPITRTTKVEYLATESFNCDEKLVTYKNCRMSYRVTSDHRMWFRNKYQQNFKVVRAADMLKWGHFDGLSGYKPTEDNGEVDPQAVFVGFYLGDGSYSSTNTVTFHLKKKRKLNFLKETCNTLGLEFSSRPSSSCEGAEVISIVTPSFLRDWLGKHLKARAEFKNIDKNYVTLSSQQMRGLRLGLINSDGSHDKNKHRINFSSKSKALIDLYETLSARLGVDTHKNKTKETSCTSFESPRTSLEARKKYFSEEQYEGKVYCSTTSTGFLLVRGSPNDFAFICGNTTPFEMLDMKFHISCPIFVARQWARHRTSSTNEYSGRYSIIPTVFYEPELDVIQPQSSTNNQGREEAGFTKSERISLRDGMRANQAGCTRIYDWFLEKNLSRELARIELPVSVYTQFYWKINLHNLFHFLSLRCDTHAQHEIREYANVLAGMVQVVAPLAFEGWLDYVFDGRSFSYQERQFLVHCLTLKKSPFDFTEEEIYESFKLKGRELEEFYEKIKINERRDFALDTRRIITVEQARQLQSSEGRN